MGHLVSANLALSGGMDHGIPYVAPWGIFAEWSNGRSIPYMYVVPLQVTCTYPSPLCNVMLKDHQEFGAAVKYYQSRNREQCMYMQR